MGAATIAVNDDTFAAEVEESPIPVLVDFWATWCGPCQMIGPILESLAKDNAGKLKVVKVDVDESGDTAGRFGISNIPCLILFKNGKEVDRRMGAAGKSVFQSWIDSKLA